MTSEDVGRRIAERAIRYQGRTAGIAAAAAGIFETLKNPPSPAKLELITELIRQHADHLECECDLDDEHHTARAILDALDTTGSRWAQRIIDGIAPGFPRGR